MVVSIKVLASYRKEIHYTRIRRLINGCEFQKVLSKTQTPKRNMNSLSQIGAIRFHKSSTATQQRLTNSQGNSENNRKDKLARLGLMTRLHT